MVRKKDLDPVPEAVPVETATADEPVVLQEPPNEPAPAVTEIAPRPERRRGGFMPLILAVLIAGGAGFGAAWYLQRETGPRVDAVEGRVAEVAGSLAEVERRLAAVNATLADVPARDSVAGLEARLSAVAGEIGTRADTAAAAAVAPVAETVARLSAALDARAAAETDLRAAIEGLRASVADTRTSVEEMRQRPAVVEGDPATEVAAAAYERELAAMREMFAQELTRVRAEADQRALALASTADELRATLEADMARMREEATRQAQAAEAIETRLRSMLDGELSRMRDQAAEVAAAEAAAGETEARALALSSLTAIESALRAGRPFLEDADTLAAALPGAPVAAIRPYADGVDTLEALQRDFPAAARAALAVAPAEGGVASFLRAQLGMRSLAPREGDTADAVLSRAEAALGQGDLSAALALVDTLQGDPAAAMAAWAERARLRVAAEVAIGELSVAVRG